MNKRILIVEDSPTQAQRLCLVLGQEGYEASVAQNGRDGLAMADPAAIDLVISDVNMPEMDGFEFCRVMKSSEATQRLPIILLTARATPADIIRGLESGADNFIPKPYDDLHLLERVRRIFDQLEHRKHQRLEMEVNLTIGGRRIAVTADRQQIMELLFSTFEEMSRHHDEMARTNKELEKARAEADRANAAKSSFISRMSHELRTPLNAILGFGQLLELDDLNERQAEGVRHILRGGRHLLDLINEILDISRVEAGRLSISPAPVRIGDVVADVLSLLAPLAEESEIRLDDATGELADAHVLADPQRLKQVLLNLVSNAIKYNRRGGAATVALQDGEPGWLRIDVRDEGMGISAEDEERLFIPFDRLGADSGDVEGTGLGLALSKRLVELMNGQLLVDSEVGRGSTFTVELATCDPAQIEIDAAGDGRTLPIIPLLPPATILYVEDNVSNLRLLEQLFAGQDHIELIPAMQGSIGLDLARRHRLDLILLDLHLPDMGGIEILERLQASSATRDVPVIVLSADATRTDVARLTEGGAREYLTKPLDIARFLDVVAGILNPPASDVS